MMIIQSPLAHTLLFCLVLVLLSSRSLSSFAPVLPAVMRQLPQRNLAHDAAASSARQRLWKKSTISSAVVFNRNLVSCNLGASPPRRPTITTSKGEFEYEELVAQMKAMRTSKLVSDDLTSEKRRELQGYVVGILRKRASPIPLTEMGENLAYTSWRLSYSTEAFAASSGLPKGAVVRVQFSDNTTAIYSLEFGEKVFALKNLKATCTWSCGTSLTAVDPTKAGVVTLTYDAITTDMFGFTNIGVGLFGMLRGRSNYIQSVYFDGNLWIEEGYGPAGEQYYNVYMKET